MNGTKNGVPDKPKAAQRDVAVYLDFENLYVSLKTTVNVDPNFDLLMEKCREFGRVTVARSYADWSEFSRMLTSQMFANGFEPVYVPTRKFYDAKTRAEARKNSVDIHITIDIVKSLFQHENVDVFFLISGDRDYVPLINQIRQHGKEVYALGVAGCTSGELSAAVDEMFFYHQLLEGESGEEKAEQIDVYNQLMRAIRIARRRGYPTTLGILKPIMRELVEGFNESNYKTARGPFQKFKDLVQEAQRRRLVRLVTTGATTEVFLFGEEPSKIVKEERREPPPARGGRGGRGRDRRGGRRPAAAQTEAAPGATGDEEAAELVAPDFGVDDQAAPAEAPAIEEGGAKREPRGRGRMRHVPEDDEESPAAAAESGVAEVAGEEAAAEPAESEQDRLTGVALDDKTWEIVRQAVASFGARPPTPRKLLVELKKAREEGRFGDVSPTDADLQELLRLAVEEKRLERVRKGFSTVYRLRDESGA